jgi:hypothetical protein
VSVPPVTVGPVPLVAAAVCPHPPLIVPEVASGAAAETDGLRSACDAAVAHLLDAAADEIVVVGAGDRTQVLTAPRRATFEQWGAPTGYSLGAADGSEPPDLPSDLPLGLLIGGWLLSRQDPGAPITLTTVAADASAARCAAWGAELGARAPRVTMLVMGDGSACQGLKSPGYDDPRAVPYDRGVARALADADPDALLGLDPQLSLQLKVAGRAPWQVLAGAARAAGAVWRGALTHEAAPYGVTYLVATWAPSGVVDAGTP